MSEKVKLRSLYLTDKQWSEIKEAAAVNHRGNRSAFIQDVVMQGVKKCLKK